MYKFANKVGKLDVYENTNGDIVINDTAEENGNIIVPVIAFDEAFAEKLCKAIMKVAKQIRERNNG